MCEEFDCGREVVNHDADVLHPLDRHVFMVTNLGSSRSEGRAFGDWYKNDKSPSVYKSSPPGRKTGYTCMGV